MILCRNEPGNFYFHIKRSPIMFRSCPTLNLHNAAQEQRYSYKMQNLGRPKQLFQRERELHIETATIS